MNTKSIQLKCALLIVSTLGLSSCASVNSQPKIQKKIVVEPGITAIETSQGNDTVYIHNDGSTDIICASRGNDFAFTQAGGNSLSFAKGSKSVGIGDDSSAGVAELGGINAGVLLSREVMYRTCEFMGNLKAINALTPEVAKELFNNALNAVLKISTDYDNSTETGQATGTVNSSAPTEN